MFRIKIALLSVLLSGSVLVGLGLFALSLMNKVGLERIDREILALGEGHLTVGPPRGYWQNFESSIRLIYRENQADFLVIQIKDPGQEVLFRSAHWPPEITEEAFPTFDRTMDSAPTARDNREGRRGPPPEAYTVCQSKKAGMPAQYVNPRGVTVRGICEEEDGTMVLRRTTPRGDEPPPPEAGPDARPSPSPDARRSERPSPRIKKSYFKTIPTASGVWRTGIMGSERITMMVGVNLAGYHEDANRYRRSFFRIVPLALLLLAVGGWVIAERALKPVALITRTAERITARDLNQRIPSTGRNDELSRLVKVINGMLERLEKSFHQAVRFSADAAHELQTPLAILQGELDDALQYAPVGSEEQERYSSLLEEVQRLKSIIQKLLILARADAGRLDLRLEAKDLSAMIEAAAEDAEVMAPQVRIEKEILPGIVADIDPDLMEQAIRNLVSNAVKYNQENGLIRFRLTVSNRQACLTVSNTGPTIPEAERAKIFDRFYRVDQSRSKTLPGAGLGLSLAREIARAHHGDLRMENDGDDMVSFSLSLPCRC